MPLDPDLMPDFTKEDQYECECAKCHNHFLGHKRSLFCPKCRAENLKQAFAENDIPWPEKQT